MLSLTHTYVSTKGDHPTDPDLIGQTKWNEEHTITMATNKLLGRGTAGTGSVEEITLGTTLTLTGTTLDATGGAPAGSSGQLQFNDSSAFGAANAWRESADVLALRNGTTAQAFHTYRTYTDGSNFERISVSWSGTDAYFGTGGAGTGSGRTLYLQGTGPQTAGSWELNSSTNGWLRYVSGAGPNYGVMIYGNNGSGNSEIRFGSGDALRWGSNQYTHLGSFDTGLYRAGVGITGVRGSSSSAGGSLSFIEQTAPSAPSANGVYLYAEDNGAGKTRLMALFATGAAQQVAIEP